MRGTSTSCRRSSRPRRPPPWRLLGRVAARTPSRGARRRPAVVLRSDDADARRAAGRRCAASIVGREKYIDLPMPELYDLAADPAEARNLAPSRADRAQVLLNTLKGFNIAPPGRPQEETPETLERLRSLGYIGGGSATVARTLHRRRRSQAADCDRTDDAAGGAGATRGADGRGDRDLSGHHREAAGHRGRLSQARARSTGARASRARRSRRWRRRSRTASRSAKCASSSASTWPRPVSRAARSNCSRRLRTTIPDALIALGNAYVAAGRPARRDCGRSRACSRSIRPTRLAHENIGIAELRAQELRGGRGGASARVSARSERSPARTPRSASSSPPRTGATRRSTPGSGRSSWIAQELERAVQPDRRTWRPPAGATRRARYGERYLAIAPDGPDAAAMQTPDRQVGGGPKARAALTSPAPRTRLGL